MSSEDPPPAPPRSARAGKEPIFDAPRVVLVLVAFLVVVHAILTYAPADLQDRIVGDFAFIPGRLTIAFWPGRLGELLARANTDPQALQQARLIRDFEVLRGGAMLWTLLTYAFLHGSWTHVGLNAIWIVAFGPPVARRIGGLRFLALFGVTAVAGALLHWAFATMDFTPLIGASAADSGLMAAAARFIFEQGGPLGGPAGYSRAASRPDYFVPAPPLLRLLRERRVVIFLLIWLATNFLFGAGAQSFGLSEAPVAWIAHVGGFAAGLLLFPLFDRRAPTVTP